MLIYTRYLLYLISIPILYLLFLSNGFSVNASSPERHELNPFQERAFSHIPMFDIDPRYIPRELRPHSYMHRLDIQRNRTDEIRIDAVRIDWFNHRVELFISGFMGDPYFIRFSQHLPRGGSLLIPNPDILRPTEGELIIFGSHAPMIFHNIQLEQGRYYEFVIYDNHNFPHDYFRFRSPYNFGPRELLVPLLDVEGKKKEYGDTLVQTNDPITLMAMSAVLMIGSVIVYKATNIKKKEDFI